MRTRTDRSQTSQPSGSPKHLPGWKVEAACDRLHAGHSFIDPARLILTKPRATQASYAHERLHHTPLRRSPAAAEAHSPRIGAVSQVLAELRKRRGSPAASARKCAAVEADAPPTKAVESNRGMHDRATAWKAARQASVEKQREISQQNRDAEDRKARGPRPARRTSPGAWDRFLRREEAWAGARHGQRAGATLMEQPASSVVEPCIPVVQSSGRKRYSSRVSDGELLRYLDAMEATL